MADVLFTNNAYSTLASGISDSDVSITVATGDGALFPTITGSDYFYATLIDVSNNLEIVKCTARSTDTLTVTRAQESTVAQAYATGDRIELRLTAASLAALSPAASETVAGKVELATTAEAAAGSDTARAVTPVGVKTAIATPPTPINLADQVLQRAELKDYSETANSIGSGGGGTETIDYTNGPVQAFTVDTSETTLAVTNWPPTGKCGSLTLVITNGGSQTFNWMAAVIWPGGAAPTLTTSGVDVVTLFTFDAGTTIYGNLAGADYS